MAKVRTQADRRQHATTIDRHGRKFSIIVEKDTMHRVAAPVPKGWRPPKLFGKVPFLPPDQHMKPAADDPFVLEIDYDTWIQEVEAEHTRYEESLGSAAILQFGSGASRAVQEKSPELLRYVGKPPMPVEPIKAARAGNLFVLGLSPHMPKWAEKFFLPPVEVQELFPNVEDDFPDEEPEAFKPLESELEEFPDVEDPADRELIVDEDFERAIDLEEQFDPQATGGKSVDPRVAATHVPTEKPLPQKNNKPKPKAKAGK